MKTNNPLRTLAMVLGVLCTANALYTTNAYAEAGFIQFVYGDARIILSTGGERPAQKGAQFNEGDTLVTGRGASVQLRMIDGALVAIRPDSRLKIETYQYSGREDGKERGALALAHGGFRTLTGAIGSVNKDRLVVSSPSATIWAGISFEATEMTPRPPIAISGNVIASSPERTMKSSGSSWQISVIWLMLPEASFTPMMFGSVAMRASVFGSTFTPARPGTL